MSQTIFDDFDALMIALPNGDDAKVWKHFISIQTDLSFDDQTTEMEKACLDELNSHLLKPLIRNLPIMSAPCCAHLGGLWKDVY